MGIPEEPSFKVQPPDGSISQFVLRILVEQPDVEPVPIGTATWVAGHLVLTARHNIEHIVKNFGARKDGSIEDYAVRLYQVLPNCDYAVWQVFSIWCAEDSDLALMHVGLWGHTGETPPDPAFSLRMSIGQCKLGDKVAGFGFHSITARTSQNADGSTHLDVNDVPQATTGVITDLFPDGRDRSMLPFPCFAVNARFDAGMSGGPIFSEKGRLIGVIVATLPGEGDTPHTSYVATLEPLLNMRIDAKQTGKPRPVAPYPVLDLVRDGILAVDGI